MTDPVQAGLKKAGVSQAERHLFVCIGPDCCASDSGQQTWEYIKQRVKETGVPVMRTKAACFRICARGPWLVVYPDGVWYPEVSPERFERILQDHILGGVAVKEWAATTNALECKFKIA